MQLETHRNLRRIPKSRNQYVKKVTTVPASLKLWKSIGIIPCCQFLGINQVVILAILCAIYQKHLICFFTIVCWKDAPHFWMLHLETAKAIKELRKLSSNTPWRAVANDEFFADFNQAAPSCCIASWDAYGWTWYPSFDVNIAVLYE